MNTKAYHFLLLPFILTLIVGACSHAPTPVPTASATSTRTPVPTSTPTITPSPTATNTPDPNKPADATGVDTSTGYYTKVEDGITYYWVPIQYGGDVENGISGHWFENRMKNGENIYLLSYITENFIPFTQFMMIDNPQLQVRYTVYHPDQSRDFGVGAPLHGLSFPSACQVYLLRRYYHVDSVNDLSYEQASGFRENILDGSATITVGDKEWVLTNGYWEFIVDYNNAATDLSFQKTGDFLWKTEIIDGKLIVLIASHELIKLSDQDMLIMALAPFWEILLNDPFPPEYRITSFYGGGLNKAAAEFAQIGSAINKTYPGVVKQPTTNFLEFEWEASE